MFRAISTSAVQRYEISERNANRLTFVNTTFIWRFFSFFTYRSAVLLCASPQFIICKIVNSKFQSGGKYIEFICLNLYK